MKRYDTEYYDQRMVPTSKGAFVKFNDANTLIQALRLIAVGMGGDAKELAKGVLDGINLY